MKLQNTGQSQISHSNKTHHDIMSEINDPDLHDAVLLSRNLMREGIPPGLANYNAASKYYVDISDVASWVGKIGGRVKRSKGKKPG